LSSSSVSLFPGLRGWLVVQCAAWIAILTAISLGLGIPDGVWESTVACGGAVSGIALAVVLRAGRRADRITLGRLLVGCLVAAAVALSEEVSWWAWSALLLAALADLLDGRVARAAGTTEQGAILDMESDQLMVLIMAVLCVSAGGHDAWVLLLPGYRYLYVVGLMMASLPAHETRPRGSNVRGRLVCGVVVAALLFGLAPVVSVSIARGPLLVAVMALGWSFGSDALHLFGGRRHRSEVA